MLGRSNLRGRAIIVQREEVFPAANGDAGYQRTHGSETPDCAVGGREGEAEQSGGNYLLPSASCCEGDK